MTLFSLVLQLISYTQQILAKLTLMKLEQTRRFDRIEQLMYDNQVANGLRIARLEALADSIDHAVEDGFARILAAVEPLPLASVSVTVDLEGQITEGATHVQLKDTQQFTFRFDPRDAKKNIANIDPSKTTMQLDNPALGTLTPDADGLGGSFVAALTGKTQMQFSLTDAVNAGDVQTGSLDIEVLPGDMVTVTVNTNAPTDQVPSTPATGAAPVAQ